MASEILFIKRESKLITTLYIHLQWSKFLYSGLAERKELMLFFTSSWNSSTWGRQNLLQQFTARNTLSTQRNKGHMRMLYFHREMWDTKNTAFSQIPPLKIYIFFKLKSSWTLLVLGFRSSEMYFSNYFQSSMK